MPHVRSLGLVLLLGLLGGAATGQIVNAPPVPEWIEAPGAAPGEPAFFRRPFDSSPGLLKAILLGATEGKMFVYLNGQPVGEFSGNQRAASLDVTTAARTGPNLLAVRAEHPGRNPTISLLLEVNGDLNRQQWLASDATWLCSTHAEEGWMQPGFHAAGWTPARSLGKVDAKPKENPFDSQKAFDAYNSWQLALAAKAATAAETFTLPPGFNAELVRSARPEEGSWVALAFDPEGRLTLAREKRGLLRIGLEQSTVRSVEVINDTLLECRGLLYAFDSLYANANNSKALFRLRDRDHDGKFEEVTEILRTAGGVGHGRNHLKLGPDGLIYLAHGNNVQPPPGRSTLSPLLHFTEDQLIPCPWDPSLFDGDVLVPAGHILQIDPEGKEVRLFAGGFRNPLDVAFNRDGEMFTFDADMEWDVGAPWYMPNRVLHVVSGADFGFRRGTGRFPDYYAETLPSTLKVGLASPTAVVFGTGSHFPANYRDALFICDWAYGRILAVHLKPNGASYRASSELFVAGRPLNVTDAAIGPDGALWFITGGRGTQSGLYRVSYGAPPVAEEPKSRVELAAEGKSAELRALRRRLERFHVLSESSAEPQVIEELWPHLGHVDPWIRHAARVALERQPVAAWRRKALDEPGGARALTAWLALARRGGTADQAPLLHTLNALTFSQLEEREQLDALRVYELLFTRWGAPEAEAKRETTRALEALYPARSTPLNHELCELLVYLESTEAIRKTLPLLAAATRSEDLLQYAFFLRYVRHGWTTEARRACFEALARAERLPGARQYFKILQDTRKEMVAALAPPEREALAASLGENGPNGPTLKPAAATVKEWQMADLVPLLDQVSRGRSFEAGRAALLAAQCLLCHRVSSDPALPAGVVGPDLTAVASRFNRRDLLEQILDPSKVIDEKFHQVTLAMQDGTEITGTVDAEDARKITLRLNPLSKETRELLKEKVRSRSVSSLSPMPAGLLNVLTAAQVLDLLAFLETGGHPAAPHFASPVRPERTP